MTFSIAAVCFVIAAILFLVAAWPAAANWPLTAIASFFLAVGLFFQS